MILKIRKLGLAAYIKMHGAVLKDVKGNVFMFESEKSETEWEVEYLNSCCHRHDTELIHLRDLANRSAGRRKHSK